MAILKLNNLSDFEPVHIFECGQCFRWQKENDGSYTGVIKYGVINIKKENKDVIISGNFDEKDRDKILDYFDCKTDYTLIKEKLQENDLNMKKAIEYGYGIRILNQDPWEMLISFIISAANNIPRISRTVENISRAYGQKISWNGKE